MNVFENDSYQLYMEYENMINNDLCNMMDYVCKITCRYFLCMALPDGSECFFHGRNSAETSLGRGRLFFFFCMVAGEKLYGYGLRRVRKRSASGGRRKVLEKTMALVVAIITGALGHAVFSRFSVISPFLLMAMLLFTFCGMSLKTVRIHRLHVMLLVLQMAGSLFSYMILAPWNVVVAQTVGLIILVPTATAAATITGMLGGSVGFLATYVFLGTFSSIVAAPLLVPMMAPGHVDMPFFSSMLSVFFKVGPILLVPFFFALGLQKFAPRACEAVVRRSYLSYYLWAAMILILMGSAFDMLLAPGGSRDPGAEALVAVFGTLVCMVQFLVGKGLGSVYHRRISAGQALAQKNLMLAMWLGFQYFDPLVVVGLAAYSIAQNVFNATQLWLKGRMDARVQERLHAYHEKKHGALEVGRRSGEAESDPHC